MSRHVVVMGAGETLLASPEARTLVLAVIRTLSRTAGVPPSPLAREIAAALDEAADRTARTAAAAAAAVRIDGDAPSSAPDDLITTKELAEMIGSKERNARDLCFRGTFATAVQLGGAWRVSRAEVAGYAAARGAA